MARDIVVIGSLNWDIVVDVNRFPGAGETLRAAGMFTGPGGKGANQAVACARLGARVRMVGRVGDDGYGESLRHALAADGVDLSHVGVRAGPSGCAFVFVDPEGGNRIVVVAGANAKLGTAEIDAAAVLFRPCTPGLPLNDPARGPLLLMQLESPLAVVMHAAASARARSCTVVLNPSPVAHRIPARKVDAIDTTAAGDTFTGAFCAALAAGRSLRHALQRGVDAAALCVMRRGAMASMPYAADVGSEDEGDA